MTRLVPLLLLLGCPPATKPPPEAEVDSPSLLDVDEAAIAAVRVVGVSGVTELGSASAWSAAGEPLVGAPGGDGAVLLAATGTSPVVAAVLATGSAEEGLGAGLAVGSHDGTAWFGVGSNPGNRVVVGDEVSSGAAWTGDPKETEDAGESLVFGDIDGDGVDELLVGVPRSGAYRQYAGAVYVIAGPEVATGGALADATMMLSTGDISSRFGTALAVADVDADGAGDVIVGAPETGAVYAWSGPPALAGTEADWISTVSVKSLGFGNTLAARFDDNGGTLVVGVPELGSVGVYTLPLPPGAMDTSKSLVFAGFAPDLDAEGDDFATVSLADLNDDGLSDLVAGLAGFATFAIRLQHDTTTGEDPNFRYFDAPILFHSPEPDRTGQSLAVGPDLDGDGGHELLVGAPEGDGGAGYAWLVWSEAWLGVSGE